MAPIDVGSGNRLLFDEYFVAEVRGFSLHLVPAVKDGPVLEPATAWEANGIWAWGSVLYEDGVVRMWYEAIGADGVWRLCYAARPDGLHFVRPGLALCEYGGSRDNNQYLLRCAQRLPCRRGLPAPRRFPLAGDTTWSGAGVGRQMTVGVCIAVRTGIVPL